MIYSTPLLDIKQQRDATVIQSSYNSSSSYTDFILDITIMIILLSWEKFIKIK